MSSIHMSSTPCVRTAPCGVRFSAQLVPRTICLSVEGIARDSKRDAAAGWSICCHCQNSREADWRICGSRLGRGRSGSNWYVVVPEHASRGLAVASCGQSMLSWAKAMNARRSNSHVTRCDRAPAASSQALAEPPRDNEGWLLPFLDVLRNMNSRARQRDPAAI